MRSGPPADNLLDTALAILREVVLPAVSSHARYEALMVANAMSIVARQIAAGDRPLEEARARLTAIYQTPERSLADMERQLAHDVRAGLFDAPGERRTAVFAHLWDTALAAAAVSHPKALVGREGSSGR
jgi:hypothetical protein